HDLISKSLSVPLILLIMHVMSVHNWNGKRMQLKILFMLLQRKEKESKKMMKYLLIIKE
ncbi:MAG: hypothetical protein ACI8RD_014655, partial [Bacillariaceae sp.]